jgi:hypothetical protein
MRSRFAPWAGWLLPALAWAVHHQAGSDLDFGNAACSAAGAPQVVLGLVCALVAALGGWLSWTSRKGVSGDAGMEPRVFIALVGAMAGGVFLLAILYGTTASLIVPPCSAA